MKLIITSSIILLTLVGCNGQFFGGKSVESVIEGEGALFLINNLNKIQSCEVYRVDDSYPGESDVVFGKKIHGYGVISGPIELDVNNKIFLSSILVDPNTYFDYSKPIDCLFRPGIAFRLTDNSNELNLLICFSCNELKYFTSSEKVGGSYFRSVKMKELAKKLFSEDEAIQSLK